MVDLSAYHLTFDAEMTTAADIDKFTYSYTNGDRTLYNNHEAQYYVDYDPSSPSNPFSFANGALTITARPTPAGGLPYTSGLLQTANTFTQSEGYFEIRAETPNAHGFWSAFWMLSTSGPMLEADILEQPNNSGSASDYWFHIATPTDNSGYFTDTGVNLASGYHTYGFKWDSSTISFYFDGKSIGYSHATPVELQGQQMYLLANLAVGGAGSWPGQPASGASAAYNIDYIRAYSTDPTKPSVALGTVSSPDGVDTTPVNGVNAPPVTVETHATVLAGRTISGSAGVAGTGALANASDPDGDNLLISAVSGGSVGQAVAGTYGHLTLNADGSYSYVADNAAAIAASPLGKHLHDGFSFTVIDSHGGATSSGLEVTLDRPPAASGQTTAVLAGATVLGSAGVAGTGALANASDPDGDNLLISAVPGGSVGQALAGTYGHLTLNADGSYSYIADNAGRLSSEAHDIFTFEVDDGHGGASSNTLDFAITEQDGRNYAAPSGGHDFLLHGNTDGSFVFGQVVNGSASFTKAGGFGSEWSFVGSGDFLGNGHTDFLLHANSGALVVGEINNGQASFTQVGGLGSEWQFSGSGNYDGSGAKDLLLHNSQDGRLVVASVVNGSASYQQIGAIGSEWDFGGQKDASGASLNPAGLTGDFLGDGHQGFLLHNTATGQIVVGEDVNGTAQFTQVGGVGNEWQFLAAGNFLGDAKQDIFMHNANTGALVVGEVAGGQLNYTQVGGFGTEWQALGAGDYLSDGHTGVLLHSSTSGALVVAEIVNAQATFTQVSSVGNEWHILA